MLKANAIIFGIFLFIGYVAALNVFGQTDQETHDDSTNKIELIKNGNFVAGLDNWRVKVFQANCKNEGDRDCTPQQFDEFPKSSVSDTQSPGQRYFVTVIPSKTSVGWFNLEGQLISASILEQDVDIPNSKKVLLSFTAKGYSDTQLEIYTKNRDDDTKTLINQLTLNDKRYSYGDVVQRSYDMTAFSGKKITVMFVSRQASVPPLGMEDVNTAVYLYNISLMAEIPKSTQTVYNGTDANPLVYGISAIIVIGVLTVVLIMKKSKRTLYRGERVATSLKERQKEEKPESQKIDGTTEPVSEKDESILRSHEPTTDIKQSPQEEAEIEYTDEHYRKLIDDEMELKILWGLYKEPGKYQNRNQLYKSFNEEPDRSKKFGKCMETLVYLDLVEKNQARQELKEKIGKTNESYVPILTPKGKELIKNARMRKITTWKLFVEKFNIEQG